MILTDLRITLEKYGPYKGKHTGTAEFTGEAGTINLRLNEHHIEEIFRTCADSIVEVSQAAARHLTCTVIEHQKAIEGKRHD